MHPERPGEKEAAVPQRPKTETEKTQAAARDPAKRPAQTRRRTSVRLGYRRVRGAAALAADQRSQVKICDRWYYSEATS